MADRLDGLDSWWSEGWKGLDVAVLGLGATGFSVADTLVELGSSVTVYSSDAPADSVELLDVIGARFVQTPLDAVPTSLAEQAPDLVVVSPGLPPHNPTVQWAVANSAVWGDIELAWRVRDKVVRGPVAAPWVTITGTNGKTTTTQLTTAMYEAEGLRAVACGNIGVPVLDVVRDPDGFDVLVVELSSHQLHYMADSGDGAVLPLASACLNIADDHLEWHGSAAGVPGRQGEGLRAHRAGLRLQRHRRRHPRDGGGRGRGRGVPRGRVHARHPGPSEVGIVEDVLCDRAFTEDRRNSALELATHADLVQAGLDSPHMTMNVLAAAALARAGSVRPSSIQRAVQAFRADHHRTERVATSADGIVWVDDSKATNPHAATASLSSFESVVWILGGQFKGVDIDGLVARFGPAARGVVVIGTDRTPVLEAFARHAPTVPRPAGRSTGH